MNILEQIEALKWHGDVSMADLKQFAADHRKLRERLADAETLIKQIDEQGYFSSKFNSNKALVNILDEHKDLAAEFRKKYPEVIE